MSKKILILSSSPRTVSNSQTLSEEFARGAQDAGHEVELIRLRDMDIHYCTGCFSCHKTGHCAQKDDAASILGKMLSADVIVLATPVYFYSMSAQLKTMIDRTVPVYTKITGKDFYFIITSADDDMKELERVAVALRGFTDGCLTGARERGILYGTGLNETGDAKGSAAAEKAYAMGREV